MIAASSRVEFAANVSEELVTEVSPLIASGLKQDRSGYYSGARQSAKLVRALYPTLPSTPAGK
jgi:hypothetical protein